ncbi:MAG: hypothetical protein WDA06_01330 [Phenylobacterium sp.]
MNWYKVSFPVFEKSQPSYNSYFHFEDDEDYFGENEESYYDRKKAYLWIIDKDFVLHKIRASKDIDGHGSWDLANTLSFVAIGRYGILNGEKVVTMIVYGSKYSPSYDRLRERIVKILDREFNNAKILDFS